MDRGSWWTTVHGVARVGHNLVTKPPLFFSWGEKKTTKKQQQQKTKWKTTYNTGK